MTDINNTTEIWQRLPNYEDFYSVSNLGNIRREKGHNGKCKVGRILKTRMATDGYLRLNISANKQRATFKVHQLVASAFLGEKPKDFVVNHKDGNKLNNLANNLEYVSVTGNSHHARDFGLLTTGRRHYSVTAQRNSKNHCTKLNEAQVKEIRQMANNGISARVIANQFHISKSNAKNIINNKIWVNI